jgi:hypothetical protein
VQKFGFKAHFKAYFESVLIDYKSQAAAKSSGDLT